MVSRQARIRQIRRENTEIRKVGDRKYIVRLRIDHQSFTLNTGFEPETSKRRAQWYSNMMAVALNRFKNGD